MIHLVLGKHIGDYRSNVWDVTMNNYNTDFPFVNWEDHNWRRVGDERVTFPLSWEVNDTTIIY